MVLACFHSCSFAKPCETPENSWFSKVFHAQVQGLTDIDRNLPSGKRLDNYGKSPCFMGDFPLFNYGHFQ
jgi:hypothetical protein